MTGIVFFGTESPATVVDFYTERLGAERWLEQPDCTILRYDNLLFGFCDREDPDLEGTITFVLDSRTAVDEAYVELEDVAREKPVLNEKYQIYQFFGTDPEGRTIEVQAFLHETDSI
ncbi:VOC family protein [Natrialbaceae archaeon A-CW2]